jgi:uncharacterized C2H2 Zn-finger protein
LQKVLKSNNRKRRNVDEIEKAPGGWKCPYCNSTMTRKQTFIEHIEKKHPDQKSKIPNLVTTNKGKEGKGKKKSSIYSAQQHDTDALCSKPQQAHESIYSLQVYFLSK